MDRIIGDGLGLVSPLLPSRFLLIGVLHLSLKFLEVGDKVAIYLPYFIVVMEGLNKMLIRAKECELFNSLKVRVRNQVEKLTQLLFANDT